MPRSRASSLKRRNAPRPRIASSSRSRSRSSWARQNRSMMAYSWMSYLLGSSMKVGVIEDALAVLPLLQLPAVIGRVIVLHGAQRIASEGRELARLAIDVGPPLVGADLHLVDDRFQLDRQRHRSNSFREPSN